MVRSISLASTKVTTTGEDHRRTDGDELIHEQLRALRRRDSPLERLVGEEPQEERTDDAADEVDGDDVERVVVAELELQLDGEEAHHAGDGADGER